MNQYIIALVGFLSFSIFLAVLELTSRKFSLSAEWVRRIPHVCAALFTIFLSFYLSPFILLSLLGIFFLIMLTSRKLKIFKHIHEVSRKTIGEELLPIGFIGAYIIAHGDSRIFVPSLLLVGLADPIAGVIMEKYKKHILGLAAFALTSFLLLILFTQIPLWIVFVIVLIVSLVERISSYGTDNLSIPLTAALLLLFLYR